MDGQTAFNDVKTTSQPPLFRFKLDDSIVELISHFAKIHMMDDRKTYKNEWNIYYENHREVFDREIQRLTELGYNNKEPIKDKMFKAGRYYFRKKTLHKESPMLHKESPMLHKESPMLHKESPMLHKESPMLHKESPMMYKESTVDYLQDTREHDTSEGVVEQENSSHKKIRMDKNILCSFDKFLQQMSSSNKIVSPEKSFENYCRNHISEITTEIINIVNMHNLSASELNIKLKETYRNRYFNIIRKTCLKNA